MDWINLKENAKTLGIDFVKGKGLLTLGTLNEIIDENIVDVTTTVGSFIMRSIRGKFARTITFKIGYTFADQWMEEALYGILYKYNNIKSMSNLELSNANTHKDGSGMYYRLGSNIVHSLRYRNYDILLVIHSQSNPTTTGRMTSQRHYTIINYNLDPNFINYLESDMITHRNALLKIKSDSPTINVYKDMHESDGYTYWDKVPSISKRRLSSIYLPYDVKKTIIDTVNSFFLNKESYKQHGITHNLKLLLHGFQGTGKDSIAKMIASEWNRNIYYVTGGRDGRFIPHAITSSSVTSPLFLISDIDKYPFLINDTDVELNTDGNNKEDQLRYKQLFGQMLNALDGVMSGEDRIIVMTTNHPEKFSPVFTRPGRVDLNIEIPCVIPEVFRKYTWDVYGKALPKDIKLKSKTLTVGDMHFDAIYSKMSVDQFINKHCK